MRPTPAFLAAAVILGLVPIASAQRRREAPPAEARPLIASDLMKQLGFRQIGPEGNRVVTVSSPVGDPAVYYAGAASGGIWKSSDGGIHWAPIFDGHPVSSIGAIAVAPSDPNIVWAGTGEPNLRSNISIGWGIYKSTDAGKSWTRMGLDSTGRIARIAIHPKDPNTLLASAVGHAYGPSQARGVFRTTDGGRSWTRVLFVDENTGANDVEYDPTNPHIVWATTWQIDIKTWGRKSGGPGSGIWKSTDGGATWTRLTGNGLPTKPFGKVDLSVAQSNPNRVYALVETSDGVPLPGVEAESGELWRTDNGGATWRVVSHDRQLAGRTQYYNRMSVMPDDENEAYFLSASWAKTLDGGITTIDPPPAEVPGWDHHDIWIDPTNPSRMIVAHDGGASVSTNRGRTWHMAQLPLAQMYHVTVDNRIPYYVYGNRQDGPSARGPSNSRMASFFGDAGIPRGLWHSVGGGESGWATPDPEDSNLVWSTASGFGAVGGIVARYDVRTNVATNVEVWPEMTAGHSAEMVKYRFQWTFPLVISPHDRNTVYVSSQHVHQTTDQGRTWREVSPDLTRGDKNRQQLSGGLTPDNIGVEYVGVIFALAESKLTRGLLWAGTNDGLVHVTTNGGHTWTNVTPKAPGMHEWGTVSNIQPSRYDANTAYLTIDGHQVNDRNPWVFKTTDLGRTWKLINAGVMTSPLSYAHWAKEDPVRRGLLYLGTENALYLSFNDGELWQPLQNNLPHAPVHDVTVQEHFNDLVLATYGRGFWILDDITPLQQLTAEIAAKDAHFFAPRPAYRFRVAESIMAPIYDPNTGTNPTYGASLNYWLKTAAADSVSIAILDPSGRQVRTLKGPAQAGINRVYWDLQSDRSKEFRMRTPPLYAVGVTVPTEGRPSPGVQRVSELMPPGRYTVRLTAGGQEMTQPLEVRKDPNTGGSQTDIEQKAALHRDLTGELNSAADMVNAIESARAQLATLKATATQDDVKAAADSLERKLIAVEEDLVQLRITGRGQDLIRYQAKAAEKLVYLINDVGSSDEAVTQPQRDVGNVLKERVRAARSALDRVINTDVAAFNRMLGQRGLAGIMASPPRTS
ncbi:MAG: sialidase [Gemmatimonadetes bacterium]|nr:sialidase [Gemmatimonadota bacterium]